MEAVEWGWVGWIRRKWNCWPNPLQTPNSRSTPSSCSQDTPILGLGPPPGPPTGHKRLYAARSRNPELNSAFVAAQAGHGREGVPRGWQRAGSRQAGRRAGGQGIGASEGVSSEVANC